MTLRVNCREDLGREVLKSDTAGIEIPEIELTLNETGGGGGIGGGFYTTVEGLLRKMKESLERSLPFRGGDSDQILRQLRSNEKNDGYISFLQTLDDLSKGCNIDRFPFTIIITDPLGNSFIGPSTMSAQRTNDKEGTTNKGFCYETDLNDPGISIEQFERTFDQNEALGLNDIKTEGEFIWSTP